MIDLMANRERQRANGLRAPARNRYFYGKLLDADHLQLEQQYFLEMSRLVNRLTVGAGVLCGLRAVENEGKVTVSPGVAIDGYGRALLVTEPQTIDPWSLDAESEAAIGESDELLLLLCYLECDAEPAPVLVADCEIREQCVPGVVRERYVLRVTTPDAWGGDGHVTAEQCKALFGGAAPGSIGKNYASWTQWSRSQLGTPSSGVRALLGELLQTACAAGPDCVPLARISRVRDDQGDVTLTVDEWGPRTTIYSNAVLLDLILCLAAQIEACCERRVSTTAPTVTGMDPAPGSTVARPAEGLKAGLVTFTFDHNMDLGRLAAPADWMRVVLRTVGASPATAKLLPVEYVAPAEEAGTQATYRLTDSANNELDALLAGDHPPSSIQILVAIRSDAYTRIVDTADPPEILDANYAGTALSTFAVRAELWELDPDEKPSLPGVAAMEALDPSDGTPRFYSSGNGIEGGIFHAWFQIDLTHD